MKKVSEKRILPSCFVKFDLFVYRDTMYSVMSRVTNDLVSDNGELKHRRPRAKNGNRKLTVSFCWTVSATCFGLENSCFHVW